MGGIASDLLESLGFAWPKKQCTADQMGTLHFAATDHFGID